MIVNPGVLTDSFAELQSSVDAVRMSPLVESFHIDIIDGQFVDNYTVGPVDLTVAEFEPAKIDFHLMVEEPMDYVFECEAIKEYLPIRQMIGQVERMSHQLDFLHEVRINGWEPVLALDLYTPLEAIEADAWSQLKHVLLLSVEAGQQGQPLHNTIYTKIKELREHFPPERLQITVDGGVKPFNVKRLSEYGVSEVVATSALWDSNDPLLALEEFYKVLAN